MKRTFLLLSIFVAGIASTGGATQAHAAEHPWLRRGVSIAACAASFYDLYTTRQDSNAGARENNTFFANPNGSAKLGKMAGFKGMLCGAQFVLGETHVLARVPWGEGVNGRTVSDGALIGFGAVQAGLFTMTAIQNRHVLVQQEAINAAARAIWGAK
jgi:hypothetical protein